MKIGIIGHGADKFTEASLHKAEIEICKILKDLKQEDVIVSGHSPTGGIDISAERLAKAYGFETDIKAPKQNKWDAEYGFKQRNIDIARDSDILYVILVDKYPPNYRGQKFEKCYHCNQTDHVKSGACWTAKRSKEFGKKIIRIIIPNNGE